VDATRRLSGREADAHPRASSVEAVVDLRRGAWPDPAPPSLRPPPHLERRPASPATAGRRSGQFTPNMRVRWLMHAACVAVGQGPCADGPMLGTVDLRRRAEKGPAHYCRSGGGDGSEAERRGGGDLVRVFLEG